MNFLKISSKKGDKIISIMILGAEKVKGPLREFSIINGLSTNSNEMIYMFDPSTGEDFKFERNLLLLHNEDFVEDGDDMLSIRTFNEAMSNHKLAQLNYDECLGFKISLFLGGEDRITNYERQDLEVYWHFENELCKKIKDLPDGTKIGKINLE